MGAKQSRVVTGEAAAELRPEDEHEGQTRASIRLTPALINQINGNNEASANAKQSGGISPQQQVATKKQLHMAYTKGADDYRKRMEVELKQKEKQNAAVGALSLAQQANLAKQQEEQENARVEQLVAEINKKKYRAPLRDVQCSPEREACLQCYRDKKSDVLKCKEVADAFVRCARQNTERFVGEN
ncbi:hypothetical protein BBO99_00004331 [Phytophthora kernoviae]|uniref:CHCH domain-containing protein n=2 Tax=Phytophthora kernoviae TaxID=325452 RepID=A0A3R7J6R3_9STRA|nr:hypothetical protein G195_003103 [Phytophthora kernoviae 00238/432]KAG2526023.1 hypothetical protein JM16_002500 [Phytophthora kernoviae]KAG2527715.1 hypothetical protein JM18_002308 [Phytophthora kernoviae]RLN10970.1 hypothetical protein BBI17_000761 [Phytophthora kernoviae]RLN80641.1 hypothetical protein BBO99_00004331 [Phytophthora kernoviae]